MKPNRQAGGLQVKREIGRVSLVRILDATQMVINRVDVRLPEIVEDAKGIIERTEQAVVTSRAVLQKTQALISESHELRHSFKSAREKPSQT